MAAVKKTITISDPIPEVDKDKSGFWRSTTKSSRQVTKYIYAW